MLYACVCTCMCVYVCADLKKKKKSLVEGQLDEVQMHFLFLILQIYTCVLDYSATVQQSINDNNKEQ